jgi:hypothetical protein
VSAVKRERHGSLTNRVLAEDFCICERYLPRQVPRPPGVLEGKAPPAQTVFWVDIICERHLQSQASWPQILEEKAHRQPEHNVLIEIICERY